MEAEAIRHNITGSDTEVLEHREFDEVPRELISNVEIGEKENQSPDQTDNQEVVQRLIVRFSSLKYLSILLCMLHKVSGSYSLKSFFLTPKNNLTANCLIQRKGLKPGL
jgi:hypothetical protein